MYSPLTSPQRHSTGTRPTLNLLGNSGIETCISNASMVSTSSVSPTKLVIHTLIECLPDMMICLIDANGMIHYSNSSFESMAIDESILHHNLFELLMDTDFHNLQQSIEECFLHRSSSIRIYHKISKNISQWTLRLLHGLDLSKDLIVMSGKLIDKLPHSPSFLRKLFPSDGSRTEKTSLGSPGLKKIFSPTFGLSKFRIHADTVHPQSADHSVQEEITSSLEYYNLEKYAYEKQSHRLLQQTKSHYLHRLNTLNIEINALLSTLEKKRTFVRAVAHEIRTPLNIVMSGLNLFEMEYPDNQAFQQSILDMKLACQAAVDIVGDFLTYEKLDSDILKLDKSVVDMSRVLKKCLSPFQVQAKFSKISLIIINQLKDSLVDADEYKLSQVLRNLVSNALKFSKAGDEVTVQASEANGVIRISVRDVGAGISKANQEKLFKEIVQFNAKELQGGGGSGIGLWVSKKLMDAHGGRIGVESEGEGKGSTFFIELPVSQQSRPAPRVSCKRLSQCILDGSFQGCCSLRILVVDDSASARKMSVRLLSKIGIHVEEAADGQECLDLVLGSSAKGSAFHAILMDSSMGTMSGPAATSELRRRGFKGRIFGVTGGCSEKDNKSFLAAGADRIYLKPLNEDSIRSILTEILASSCAN